MTVGSLTVPNPYIMEGSYKIVDKNEQGSLNESKKAKYTLSLTEQIQFARQITLGMVSEIHF